MSSWRFCADLGIGNVHCNSWTIHGMNLFQSPQPKTHPLIIIIALVKPTIIRPPPCVFIQDVTPKILALFLLLYIAMEEAHVIKNRFDTVLPLEFSPDHRDEHAS